MTTRTSHYRDIGKPQLQWMLELLKDAGGKPMTVGDIRRELMLRGLEDRIEAIPTVIWEICQNDGYTTSGGVYFPTDKKWRYWLVQAPGWTPSWKVTKDFSVVPAGDVTEDDKETRGQDDQGTDQGITEFRCKACGSVIEPGPPFCSDTCKTEYFNRKP
jgi:hypothetical protein